MKNLRERVADKVPAVEPAKALFTVLALPFYLVGLLLGLCLRLVLWAYAAVTVGIGDGKGS